MTLKRSDLVKKAKEKGIDTPPHGKETTLIKKPWQRDNNKKDFFNDDHEKIISISPEKIKNWDFFDRQEVEYGNLEALANDLIKIGQQQPCIVRKSTSKDYEYELIVGERRWRAAKIANIDLKVIIKEKFSDQDAALAQATENDNRVDLSDFSKGMSFAKLIDHNVISQRELQENLGKSKQYVSALLSYSKIPKEIIKSIKDWSKVSTRTAQEIVRLSKKGDIYIESIKDLSKDIEKGIGYETIKKKVSMQISPSMNKLNKTNKIISSSGQHIFTWRKDNNNLPSIHFPKNIDSLFMSKKINIDELTEDIKKIIEEKLNLLK